MASAVKTSLQKTGKFFATLDQSVYRATVAASLCLVFYILIMPVYQINHIDYMLNSVFVIASLTKAATMRAAVDRAFATLFGILVGSFAFLHAHLFSQYWLVVALAVFAVVLIDYLFFGYYVNVAVMVCWALMNGGVTTWTDNVPEYIVVRIVTNAVGIGICLLVYLLWPSKVRKFAFRSQMEKLIEQVKTGASVLLSNQKKSDVHADLMELHKLVDMHNVIADEASITLKGTRDPRTNRVLMEIKAAIFNLNMLNDVSGKVEEESAGLVKQTLGAVELQPNINEGVEQDDYAFNYHLQLLCRHLLMAERINKKLAV